LSCLNHIFLQQLSLYDIYWRKYIILPIIIFKSRLATNCDRWLSWRTRGSTPVKTSTTILLKAMVTFLCNHPPVKGTMHIQICQNWTDDSALRGAGPPLTDRSIWHDPVCFQKSLNVEDHPFAVRMFSDQLHHQRMIDIVE